MVRYLVTIDIPSDDRAPEPTRILILGAGREADALTGALRTAGEDVRWISTADPIQEDLSGWVPEVVVVTTDIPLLRATVPDWCDTLPLLVQRWRSSLVVLTPSIAYVKGSEPILDVADEHLSVPVTIPEALFRIRIALRIHHLVAEVETTKIQLRSMAHDLRSPIQGIVMCLESILHTAEQAHLEEIAGDARDAQGTAEHMAMLIKKWSRIHDHARIQH